MGSRERAAAQKPLWRALSLLRGFAGTAAEVALRPAAFFREVPGGRSVPGSLVFAVACALISTFLARIDPLTGIRGDWAGFGGALEILGLGGSLWLAFVITLSGILQPLVCLLAGRGRRGAGTTLKVVSYGSTAQLGSWIPYLGWLFDLYFFYLVMVGVREAHRTSEDRAIIVTLIPLFLIFFTLMIVSLLGVRGAFEPVTAAFSPGAGPL